MAEKIENAAEIPAQGTKPKLIQEFFGLVNTNTKEASIARMKSPEGWSEPGQTPEFREYTVVLKGTLHAKTRSESFDITAGQAFLAEKDEWVQYSTPCAGGAEYIAVCVPAFSPRLVHRDGE